MNKKNIKELGAFAWWWRSDKTDLGAGMINGYAQRAITGVADAFEIPQTATDINFSSALQGPASHLGKDTGTLLGPFPSHSRAQLKPLMPS